MSKFTEGDIFGVKLDAFVICFFHSPSAYNQHQFSVWRDHQVKLRWPIFQMSWAYLLYCHFEYSKSLIVLEKDCCMHFSNLYRRSVRSSQTMTYCLPSIFLMSLLLVRNTWSQTVSSRRRIRRPVFGPEFPLHENVYTGRESELLFYKCVLNLPLKDQCDQLRENV